MKILNKILKHRQPTIITIVLLLVVFITCMSLVNKPDPTPPSPSSSGQLIGSGPGYKLYRHTNGPDRIYVVKSTDNFPVSISN